MSDREIEAKIQAAGKNAPRVTPADIEANIAQEIYFTPADAIRFAYLTSDPDEVEARQQKNSIIEGLVERTYSGACIDIDTNTEVPTPTKLLIFCLLILRNGFTVTGESACASPENFDPQIGRDIARQNAVAKIWPLLGYELRSKLAAAPTGLPPIEGVLGDPRIMPAAGAKPTPDVAESLEALSSVVKEIPIAASAALADRWKPTIGRIVTVKGYIANGSDEHPGMITRVFGVGEGALVNVTVFPDLQSPKILSSIPAYTSRTAARDAIVGPSRANGFAFFPDRG